MGASRMRTLSHLVLILTALSFLSAANVADANAKWNKFLSKYLDGKIGRVKYADMKAGELADVLNAYAKEKTEGASDAKKKAVYINLYNAGMMYNILKYAKEKKIDPQSKEFTKLKINDLKVDGGNIWNGSYKIKFGNLMLTLDNIEHDLIRGKGEGDLAKLKVQRLDPRIHVAVNCAAISCPKVREKAYTEANVDQMLDENMKDTVNNPEQFSKVSDGKAKVNSIFFWYYSDFDETARKEMKLKGAGEYLGKYVGGTKDSDWLKTHLAKNFNDRSSVSLKLSPSFDFFYNWKVNDIRN